VSAVSLGKARMRVIDGGASLAIDEPASSTEKVGLLSCETDYAVAVVRSEPGLNRLAAHCFGA
jgi:hypothetical protein